MADKDSFRADRLSGDATTGGRAESAADKALRVHHTEPATTGDHIGEAVGGFSGVATGAALGSLGGPIGTVIGGIAGAITGWWTGRAISEAASTFDEDEPQYRDRFRERHLSSAGSSSTGAIRAGAADTGDLDTHYNRARPAYQLGHLAGMNPAYQGRTFDEVEPDLRRGWTDDVSREHGDWNAARDYARDAFSRGQERHIRLHEEQLSVGTREVQAGEVQVRKTVETESVRETVPLVHEEVSIERRPLSADSARDANLTIGEERIEVPLMSEEAVVQKRVVPTEEVVVRTNQVTEQHVVEDTVRRERLDTDRLEGQRDVTRRDADVR
ncbi:MAG TPA: DUF2382 domain-containing protein [Gemmatirosa sp.]|nr:DUF2382 domain-containing protein [Gemmatirosa sp.]